MFVPPPPKSVAPLPPHHFNRKPFCQPAKAWGGFLLYSIEYVHTHTLTHTTI